MTAAEVRVHSAVKGKARSLAVSALTRIFKEKAYANLVIATFLKRNRLDERETALFYELVAGTTRRVNTIDWVINRCLKSGNLSDLPDLVRDALRVGVYQELFLDGVEPSCVVDASVEIVKGSRFKGFAGMVNAVLRKIDREGRTKLLDFQAFSPEEALALQYSFPQWLVEKWLEKFTPDDVAKICGHFNLHQNLFAYCNFSKQSLEDLLFALQEEGWECTSRLDVVGAIDLGKKFKPEKSKAFATGGMHVLDLPSILVGKAVGARPGDKVIDLCSAPGGKAFCMAADMNKLGHICACDIDAGRLGLVRENRLRLGYHQDFIELIEHDAEAAPPEAWLDSFDRVLVDAPCSGTGVLGKKPDARWRKDSGDFLNLARLQRKILEQAALLVKMGGTLVYSTCSMEQEEGEDVIATFLASNPNFTVEPFSAQDQLWSDFRTKEGYIRTQPHLHGIDGFFIARLVRKVY